MCKYCGKVMMFFFAPVIVLLLSPWSS